MFDLSLTICEIFAQIIQFQKFDLENEGQGVEKLDLRHSIKNFRIHIRYFFKILATKQHTFTQEYTHTYICTYIQREPEGDDYRQNLQSRFA